MGLYLRMESEAKIRDEGTAAFTKALVVDTTTLVTAYAAQITNLANAILAALDMKLSQAALKEWREANLEKVDLTLQGE
jgi:hypothetical protein